MVRNYIGGVYMALIKCPECGKEISNKASACPNCGYPISQQDNRNDFVKEYDDEDVTYCPQCGSRHIRYEREENFNLGISSTSFSGSKHGHGCLYTLLIGWWARIFVFLFKIILACCTFGLSLFIHPEKKIKGRTISAGKAFNRTVAVCQNCGHSWNPDLYNNNYADDSSDGSESNVNSKIAIGILIIICMIILILSFLMK